jgi:tetratricopeptide (TPR) repeat protein
MDYVDEFMASSAAELPSPESISSSVGGLRLLARMRAWGKVASLAQQLLKERSGIESSKEDACSEVHVYYYFALLKLGRPPFADLRTQLDAFMANRGNAAATSRWVVALELLQLELLQYSEGPGSQDACLDGLGRLQRRLNDRANDAKSAERDNEEPNPDGASGALMTSSEARLWARRVTMSICNAAVRTSKWRVALVALEALRPNAAFGAKEEELGPLEVSLEVEMLSRIGKVFLQMGQLEEAANFLAQAAAAGEGHKNTTARVTLNNGLMAFARSDFRTAMQLFQEVGFWYRSSFC